MSESKYAMENYDGDRMAKATGTNLSISTKKTIEVANFIRGKKVKSARTFLSRVLEKKDAVPYKRFNQEMAHNQRGPSGYPINVVNEVLKLITSAESNAKSKGLNVDSLKIVHICANKGPKMWHRGRQGRTVMKRTHLELVLEETEKATKPTKKNTKPASDKKTEEKKETKKTETPKVDKPKIEEVKSETKTEDKK